MDDIPLCVTLFDVSLQDMVGLQPQPPNESGIIPTVPSSVARQPGGLFKDEKLSNSLHSNLVFKSGSQHQDTKGEYIQMNFLGFGHWHHWQWFTPIAAWREARPPVSEGSFDIGGPLSNSPCTNACEIKKTIHLDRATNLLGTKIVHFT